MQAAPLSKTRKPGWLRRPLPNGPEYEKVRRLLAGSQLSTVCQEAKCPNMWECFSKKTATFMILGSECTRNCRFCNVTPGTPPPPDPGEPGRVARAALDLGLSYVVVTSVTRDDLPDGGAAHFAATINEIKALLPRHTRVEVLIPDFKGNKEALYTVLDARPHVLNHNIETVPALYETARPQADYEQSLTLLRRAALYRPGASQAKNGDKNAVFPRENAMHTEKTATETTCSHGRKRRIPVKSGLMVGLGETRKDLEQTICDLKDHGCDILTIGQYLQPSRDHLPVVEYYTPETFKELEIFAREKGFKTVASGPFVRSSYQADQLCPHCREKE
ncbi:lipoic acid synthetase [Desulfocicer vacuolatum DSM 3385]|uniref:Lipoyl synthase n=1 Tax=Desulfocicer vacuolatum DSM 3385 TaxID=1121400 RepID=A0A1W1Z7D7_9BACT|nr:lipoyl synthase [Desulfocicer vacuolatum]SMC44323.1 lipoic acid synthetase [Desulfocicer vacuolatum DSM 3385]